MKHVCRRCLTAFSSQPVLTDHIDRCQKQQPTNITFSWRDQLKLEDYHMKIPLSIRVYADFDCINQPTYTAKLASHNPNVVYKHIPVAVGYYLISPPGSFCVTPYRNEYYSYFDEGCTGGQQSCVEWFVDEMLTLQREAKRYFKKYIPLEMSPEEEQFEQSTICWLCENPLGDTQSTQSAPGASGEKVRDHDHLTGKYRVAAHYMCNINCKQKQSSFVPIFFHIFSSYDCHLIFEQLITSAYNLKLPINIIPKSLENYVSVQVGSLRFLDSYRFLSSSLQKFTASLDTFKYMDSMGLIDDLFKKDLVYPYEKFNLENMSQSLNKEYYWSTLTQSYPRDDNIKRTQQRIDKYNITTPQQLTMLYLKMDVLQLSDVLENFVESSTRGYNINRLYSYSLPGYT